MTAQKKTTNRRRRRNNKGAPRKHARKKTARRRNPNNRSFRPPKHQKVNYTSDNGNSKHKKKRATLPDPGDNLRVIPLGGVEEIGKNMTVLEYKDEIIIVDCGFQFSEAETPGIDFIIPNVTYLEERKDKIKGIFITHGHYDHIGAVPYILGRIGNPPIYSRAFGAAIIQKRQTEFPDQPKLDMHIIEGDEKLKIGKHFKVEFFAISHAIPDSMGLIIETPVGDIAFIEDVRVDHLNDHPTESEVAHYERFKGRNMLLMTLDSTGIMKHGFSLPESIVIQTIDDIIKNVQGRLIIGTFASQVERVMQFIQSAQKYGKYVVIDGRSMKSNVEIIKELKLMKLENIIPIDQMKDYPPDKIIVIATGAQGEPYSVFDRIANKNHKYITLSDRDTVLLSSSVIPGNEGSIGRLKDNLYRQNPRIITYHDADVHASGHGSRGELGWIHTQINYKYFMPVHGEHYMLRMHGELSEELGTPKENIVIPDNGSIIEFTPDQQVRVLKEKAPVDPVMVDGFSVSEMQNVVVKDRQALAEDGIFVIVVTVNPRTGKVRKSPDIVARGFVYLRESQMLLDEARAITKRVVEKMAKESNPIDFDGIKNEVTEQVRKHLFQRTAKSPTVIPVIIGV